MKRKAKGQKNATGEGCVKREKNGCHPIFTSKIYFLLAIIIYVMPILNKIFFERFEIFFGRNGW